MNNLKPGITVFNFQGKKGKRFEGIELSREFYEIFTGKRTVATTLIKEKNGIQVWQLDSGISSKPGLRIYTSA